MTDGFAAVILAGGAGRRLGGVDKPAVAVGGRPMLHRVLAAVADAVPRVVVGPSRAELAVDVVQVREEPPGGGPVAATAAGLDAVPEGVEWVALLAADLPYLTPEAVRRLRAAGREQAGNDGVLLVDEDGRAQLLCGVWRVGPLRARLAALGEPAGESMRKLVSGVRVGALTVQVTGPVPPPWYDCDTEEDLRRAEEWT